MVLFSRELDFEVKVMLKRDSYGNLEKTNVESVIVCFWCADAICWSTWILFLMD